MELHQHVWLSSVIRDAVESAIDVLRGATTDDEREQLERQREIVGRQRRDLMDAISAGRAVTGLLRAASKVLRVLSLAVPLEKQTSPQSSVLGGTCRRRSIGGGHLVVDYDTVRATRVLGPMKWFRRRWGVDCVCPGTDVRRPAERRRRRE